MEACLPRDLPDREASLIKKEYCRCGPHPLQVISSRARPPLVKGVGHIGPLFPEFQGWPLWFMTSIALQGPHQLAPEVVPGASLHSEALSPECGRECHGDWRLWASSTCRSQAIGTIGANCSWASGVMTPGPLPQSHGWVRSGLEVSRFPHFWVGGLASAEFPRGVDFQGSLAPFFSPHP